MKFPWKLWKIPIISLINTKFSRKFPKKPKNFRRWRGSGFAGQGGVFQNFRRQGGFGLTTPLHISAMGLYDGLIRLLYERWWGYLQLINDSHIYFLDLLLWPYKRVIYGHNFNIGPVTLYARLSCNPYKI